MRVLFFFFFFFLFADVIEGDFPRRGAPLLRRNAVARRRPLADVSCARCAENRVLRDFVFPFCFLVFPVGFLFFFFLSFFYIRIRGITRSTLRRFISEFGFDPFISDAFMISLYSRARVPCAKVNCCVTHATFFAPCRPPNKMEIFKILMQINRSSIVTRGWRARALNAR